jgi:hypothetical protein
MTTHVGNVLTIDRTKFTYTIFYYPGSGGHIVGWLLGVAHEYLLLPKALECFPLELKNNPLTVRSGMEGITHSGWCHYENVQVLNPYAKLIFIYAIDPNNTSNNIHGTLGGISKDTHGTLGGISKDTDKFNTLNKVIKLSSMYTQNIFLTMSPNARMRACYEKGVRPFRTNDSPTKQIIKDDMSIFNEKQKEIVKTIPMDHFFNYNSIYNDKYLDNIQAIIDHPLTDAHIEALEKLVNRYIQITPPKLLKIINNENKLS